MKRLTPYEAYIKAKILYEKTGKSQNIYMIYHKENLYYPYCIVCSEYEMPMTKKYEDAEFLEEIGRNK